MRLSRLILKELVYRKLNLALGLLSVVVAVGCLVAELTVLRAHDLRTNEILAAKEARTRQEMARLEDEMRKSMKKLGFNILILPRDQNLEDLFASDYASKYMPEDYATKLIASRVVTVQHLLPSLRQKVEWTEQKGQTIVLVGVRGEVAAVPRDPREAMLQPVPPGTMVVGYLLHKNLGLAVGQHVKLLGADFTVHQLQPQRGDKDDVTVWVNLAEAQRLLKKEGLVNEILALKCQCAGVGLPKVRAEVERILPDTQVVEVATKAIARAEAREAAAATAEQQVEDERQHRADLRGAREAFAAWLIPLVTVACTVWIGFLAFGNVRERMPEIGVLRAIGLRSRDVFYLFLGKAMLIGLAGAALGYAAGLAIGVLWGDAPMRARGTLFDAGLLVQVLLMAPLLSGIASWIPAMMAAQQDPAVVLREG